MSDVMASGERLRVGVSPAETFYPEGYVPSWWACDVCRALWHDDWEAHTERDALFLAWDAASLCDGGAEHGHIQDDMRKVSDYEAAELYRNGYQPAEGRSVQITSS